MIHEFCNYLRSVRGYSANTIRAYESDLRAFSTWAMQNIDGARWSTISRDDLDEFLKHQQEAGLKATTTNRQLASISALYRYFQRQGLLSDNPCKYESRRKQPQTIPATLKPEQIAKAYQRAHGVKKTMLGILATTGIRIQELLDLHYEDIDFETSTIHINGKGSKERMVTTDATVLETLKRVKEDLNAFGRIFYISQRQARYMIYETLAPYCKSIHLNPHTIRHTFATELAKAGENTAAIAKILGHSHIETSQKYINLVEMPKAHYSFKYYQN